MPVCVVGVRPPGVGGGGHAGPYLEEVPGLASSAILRVPSHGRLRVPGALGPSGRARKPYTKATERVCGSGDLRLPPAND